MNCDVQKPRCAHCIVYEIDSTYTAPSRTPGPKKQRNYAKVEDGISNMQGRLGRLNEDANDRASNDHGGCR